MPEELDQDKKEGEDFVAPETTNDANEQDEKDFRKVIESIPGDEWQRSEHRLVIVFQAREFELKQIYRLTEDQEKYGPQYEISKEGRIIAKSRGGWLKTLFEDLNNVGSQ